MATYIRIQNGNFFSLSAVSTSVGVADADKVVATDSTGKIDLSLIPNSGVETIVAGEALTAGNYVHVQNNGSGGFQVVKADSSLQKEAHGFVLQSVANGANATVYFEGSNSGVTGQTPGKVYLANAGIGSSIVPTTANYILQNVGYAVSATRVNFESNLPVILAGGPAADEPPPPPPPPEDEPTCNELLDLYNVLKEKIHDIEE